MLTMHLIATQALLDAVDKMSLDAMPKNAKRAATLVRVGFDILQFHLDTLCVRCDSRNNMLLFMTFNFISPVHSYLKQTSFRDESKAMREETSRLEDTNNRLQAEVNSLRQRLSQTDRSLQHAAESKNEADSNGRNTLRTLERSLEEAKEENNKRISETSQFVQMRKLMQSQSAKIRDLRKRLEKYEPDSVKEDDGEDF